MSLEVLEEVEDKSSPQPQMLEFVLAGQGTVIVKEEEAAYANIYRVTDWLFAQDEDGIISVKEHESHASTANWVHEIFRDTKPSRNIDAVVDLLLPEGVIKNNR